MPPGSIWPPVINNALPGQPGHPDQGLPGDQPHPDQGLPRPPPAHGHPDQGLPSQKYLVAICAVSAGGGLKVIGYTVVDPSLDVWGGRPPPYPDQGLPGSGNRPANPIQPTPEPKR
jgi:hypothetical protein